MSSNRRHIKMHQDFSLAQGYCNGRMPLSVPMAPKKELKIRKGKIVPNKESVVSASSSPSLDGRSRFADKLKTLLKTGVAVKEEPVETDDPYAFSEPEPQVLRLYKNTNTNASVKKSGSGVPKDLHSSKHLLTNSHTEKSSVARMYPTLSQSLAQPVEDIVIKTEVKCLDEDSPKTMNRLQAKIAQNKVMGKHRKSSPSPKLNSSLLEEQLLGLDVKREPTSPRSYRPSNIHSITVSVPAKRRRSSKPCPRGLESVRQAQDELRDYRQDLFPLGVEVSESDDSEGDEETSIYQRHWFSASLEENVQGHRDSRLSQMRTELRRRLGQVCSGLPEQRTKALVNALIGSAKIRPSSTAVLLSPRSSANSRRTNRSKVSMLVKRICCYRKGEVDACTSVALPCTQHCIRHIMYNVDQLLFEHCTAKFSDNTQCCIPVFDICHELPLCLEHARKRDNYDKMCAEVKPKKVRKKAKPSAMTRPNKRGKKKKKAQKLYEASSHSHVPDMCDVNGGETSSATESIEPIIKEEVLDIASTPDDVSINQDPTGFEQDLCGCQFVEGLCDDLAGFETVEEQVLPEELPLDPVELASQASRLLEEHDLTNVLNQIPADAFNDIFTDKNGEYEPTREETEELERALEAVDKDVKSLEKLSQTQGLLDMIDDHTLVQTLAQLPEVSSLAVPGIVPVYTAYHNGFVMNAHPSASTGIKNVVPIASESPASISIQTQTDTPS